MEKEHKQLVWLGAGKAREPSIEFEKFDHCFLIEADSKAYSKLTNNLSGPNISTKFDLISVHGGIEKFKRYNFSQFSALNEASELKSLFPGLRLNRAEERETVAIAPLIESLSLLGRKNWLVIDVMDISLAILKRLAETGLLPKFEKIIIPYSNQKLYKGMASQSELYDYLEGLAYEIINVESNDPDFTIAEFKKNTEKELLAKLDEKHKDALNNYAELLRHSDRKIAKLEEDIKSNEKLITRLFKDQNANIKRSIDTLTKTIKFHSSSTAKQIESSFSIQRYLENGEKSLNFHGWPISADLGAYLIEYIDSNNFDAIIEFGSGTSTLLMAKAIKAKREFVVEKKVLEDKNPVIISFEHNEKYFRKTQKSLNDEGLSYLVNLVYAPLGEYIYQDGRTFSYYDCSNALENLADTLKPLSSLLVLIDGPPEATNDHARFPAIPHLLKYLGEHNFTILLDDYDRSQEKEAMKEWIEVAEALSFTSNLESIRSEKGLAILNISKHQ